MQPVILLARADDVGLDVFLSRRGEDRGQVESVGLPMADRVVDFEQIDASDHLADCAESEPCHDLARVFSDHEEVVDHVLGLAGELLPQFGVLGGHAYRAGVQMALAHHDAPERDQRGGGETELLGAEQGGDDHVAAGPQPAVGLEHDAAAQIVEHEGLVGFGQPELPRQSGVLDACPGGGAGAAVVAGDENLVGEGLGHARRDRSDAHLGDELDTHPCLGIGAFQVMDQLLQVFDRVDVVVRRGADQADAGRRMPDSGDVLVDLVSG